MSQLRKLLDRHIGRVEGIIGQIDAGAPQEEIEESQKRLGAVAPWETVRAGAAFIEDMLEEEDDADGHRSTEQ